MIGENTKIQYFIIKLFCTICFNVGQVVSDNPAKPYNMGSLTIIQKSILPQDFSLQI